MIRNSQAESIAEEECQHDPAGEPVDLPDLRSAANRIRFPAGLAAGGSRFEHILPALPQAEDRIPAVIRRRRSGKKAQPGIGRSTLVLRQ